VPADQTSGPSPGQRGEGGRGASSLGPHVVGQRIVVRRVLRGETGPTGGPAMTDVLGVCLSWADGRCVVRREDGDPVEIDTADIVSGKPVPPRPTVHRHLGAAEADRRALPGWQPVESEPLGEWVLRASGGFSSRANSVLALGDPGLPLDEAVARVEEWYRSHSLAPRAHVHPGDPASAAFTAAGWTSYDETLLMLASVSRVLRRLPPARTDVTPRHEPTLDAGWLATDERAARYAESARAVLETGEVTFVTVRDESGAVLARGRGAAHGDWVGVSALWTRPDLRGSGLGSAVLRSVLTWGAERGATTSYLQVVATNTAAQELYETDGYEVHHRYRYLVADLAP
jgi:GNAT superfamily N-acetyltransferase